MTGTVDLDEEDYLWIHELREYAEGAHCILLRLTLDEYEGLSNSKNGFNEFTIVRSHENFTGIKKDSLCLIYADFSQQDTIYEIKAYVGVIASRQAVSTLDTRIKITHAYNIHPHTEEELSKIIKFNPYKNLILKQMDSQLSTIVFSPKLSRMLVSELVENYNNHKSLKLVYESLHAPKTYSNIYALQEDAVQTALKAFGLTSSSNRAEALELQAGRSTALVRVKKNEDTINISDTFIDKNRYKAHIPLIEDSVIEHDARSVPGYTFETSDLTGRARFRNGEEFLDVYTANRRDLEHTFGVDLIYLNITKKNIVMIQYKMLEASKSNSPPSDWIYRPDGALEKEIQRMKVFSETHRPIKNEYRLNSQVFYLKFVKRDAALSHGSLVMPIDHYEQLLESPSCIGDRGAVRISYNTLNGSYLRQTAFHDLIRSGYIGAYANTTKHLKSLIEGVLIGDRAVVLAIQAKINSETSKKLIK